MKTKKLFFTFFLFFALNAGMTQDTWYEHYVLMDITNFNAVDFNNSDLGGALCGDQGTIAGWQICITDLWCNTNSPTTKNLFSLKLVDSSSITKAYIVGESGKILKSNFIPDYGSFEFYIQNSPTTQNLYSVYFTNYQTGIAVGDAGTVIRTTDGGGHWNTISSITPKRLYSVHFPSTNLGYAVGNDGIVIKTTNNGQNWSIKTQPIADSLRCVWFVDDNTGFVVSRNGAIFKTSDGGDSWQSKPSGISQNLNAIRFVDLTTGYTAGNANKVLKTTDAGETWMEQTLPTLSNHGDFLSIAKTYIGGICIVGTNRTAIGNFPDEVSINKIQNQKDLFIYPNPAKDKIKIQTNLQGFTIAKVTIYNLQGQLLLQEDLTQSNNDINISQLNNGIYITKIRLEDGCFIQKKFVVMK